jgi:hypothetical protein
MACGSWPHPIGERPAFEGIGFARVYGRHERWASEGAKMPRPDFSLSVCIQVLLKPVAGQRRDLVKLARFFEKVGRTPHYLDFVPGAGWQLSGRRIVQIENHGIMAADDEQNRRGDSG